MGLVICGVASLFYHLHLSGAITNIMLTPTPPCLTSLDVRPPPSTILPQFQRHLACNEADNVAAGSVTVTLRKRQVYIVCTLISQGI